MLAYHAPVDHFSRGKRSAEQAAAEDHALKRLRCSAYANTAQLPEPSPLRAGWAVADMVPAQPSASQPFPPSCAPLANVRVFTGPAPQKAASVNAGPFDDVLQPSTPEQQQHSNWSSPNAGPAAAVPVCHHRSFTLPQQPAPPNVSSSHAAADAPAAACQHMRKRGLGQLYLPCNSASLQSDAAMDAAMDFISGSKRLKSPDATYWPSHQPCHGTQQQQSTAAVTAPGTTSYPAPQPLEQPMHLPTAGSMHTQPSHAAAAAAGSAMPGTCLHQPCHHHACPSTFTAPPNPSTMACCPDTPACCPDTPAGGDNSQLVVSRPMLPYQRLHLAPELQHLISQQLPALSGLQVVSVPGSAGPIISYSGHEQLSFNEVEAFWRQNPLCMQAAAGTHGWCMKPAGTFPTCTIEELDGEDVEEDGDEVEEQGQQQWLLNSPVQGPTDMEM